MVPFEVNTPVWGDVAIAVHSWTGDPKSFHHQSSSGCSLLAMLQFTACQQMNNYYYWLRLVENCLLLAHCVWSVGA